MLSPVRAEFLGSALLVCAVALGAGASERRFTYTYESGVLNPGAREFEPWTTVRVGRQQYFARFDERLEFELGLAEGLQSALYLNFDAATVGPTREQELEFGGISSEWKLKVSDPVADALGLALYLEVTGAPAEVEVEAKVITDKRVGPWLIAGNLVGEYEVEFAPGEAEKETQLEVDAGLTYFLNPAFSAGVEARHHDVWVEEGGLAHSAVFAGPVLSYAQDTWWATLTVMAQLRAFKGASDGRIDMDEYERLAARLVFGWHI